MSYVDNCILSFSILEDDDKIQEVNSFFTGGQWGSFVSADDDSLRHGWYGGTKYLETPLFIAALNYFAEEEFIEHLSGLNWRERENVQLIIKRQEEDAFVIVGISSRQQSNQKRSDSHSGDSD